MSYAKPFWMTVTSCKYKSNKSFGASDDCKLESYTGSSVNNSSLLATIEWSKKVYDKIMVFNLYIDGELIKQNIHIRNKKNMKVAGDLLETRKKNFINSSNEEKYSVKL